MASVDKFRSRIDRLMTCGVRWSLVALSLVASCLLNSTVSVGMEQLSEINVPLAKLSDSEPSYRVPVDLTVWNSQLWTANSRTGSVSRIDLATGRPVAEYRVAKSLSSLARWKNGLLVLDDQQHQIVRCVPDTASGDLQLAQTISVSKYPVKIAVSSDESIVAVSSLWSRRLTLLGGTGPELQVQQTLDLPFAPRLLKFLPGGLLIVADAFGGQLAIVETATASIKNYHSVYGHNIRGLEWNPVTSRLMVACQTLDPATFTSYERIFWGVLMQNGLHSVSLEQLSGSTESRAGGDENPAYSGSYGSSQQYPLGTPSIGSGDPGAMVMTKNDTTLLVLSGVNQVALRTASHLPFERLKTGARPEAVCLDDAEQRAFIANRFDDTITVVSLAGDVPTLESAIRLGEIRPLSVAEHGEQIFHDATVSLDGWFSCHSCHTDGHTNGGRADTFGDEDKGAAKKIVSLLGAGHSSPWAWNGSKDSLEDQIRTSLIISMQTQMPSDQLPIESLAAYLRTLKPAPSLATAREDVTSESELLAARTVFTNVGCRNCHAGQDFTSSSSYDVGIHDEMGETLFNPPSLLGVSQRAPYFHDGRASTLADVLKSSHHDSQSPLTEQQIQQLTLFLEQL